MRVLILILLNISIIASTNILKGQLVANQKTYNEWTKFELSQQKSASKLSQDKVMLNLSKNEWLSSVSIKTDELGYTHSRFQQYYKDLPIEGAIYIMHEKNNKVTQANGKLVRDLDLSTVPAINKKDALEQALQYIDATLYAWNDTTHEKLKKQIEKSEDATFYPKGELVIIDPKFGKKVDQYRLAYKFDIYAVEPLQRSVVFVDAQNGLILTTIEKIHDCTNVAASGITNYSGNVNFTACVEVNDYILKNNVGGGMQVYNANNTQSNPQIPFIDYDSFFEGDPTANEVHWATEETYKYFQDEHSRNSLDGNGMPLNSWVHFDNNYNNAFWNGNWMTYGDGDNITFSSLTSPDVVAHEMVHGITQFSAGLNYSYESGALNESFSDIFGEILEQYMRGSSDWVMGADFTVKMGKNGLRSLSNPNASDMLTKQPDTYLGNDWYTGNGDFGGVHYNSGVQNYWFYLLAEGDSGVNDNGYTYNVNGIGMDKAAAIAYRNLTVYLTPTSQYIDAREGSIAATWDLVNTGFLTTSEAQQVEDAWCAVGVGNCSSPCRLTDSLALVALYNSTNGANWTHTWDLTQPMDTWYGINLNSNGCVTCIDMDGGHYPCNDIYSSKSDFVGFGGNNLSGSLPVEIGNMNDLIALDLRSNNLTGNIPVELGDLINLTFLNLGDNQLGGNIPVEIGNLINLTILNLFYNQLGGSIPNEIGNLINLNELILSYNQLSGTIPSELGNLANLTELRLRENQLIGSIPIELGNLINLEILSVSENQLSSSIPAELGNLTELTDLILYNNQLNGIIPAELGNLFNLETLSLTRNQLNGNIPSELGNLINLKSLGLAVNQLNGNIPIELGNLFNLEHLYLSDNQLNGTIPVELGNLSKLFTLGLGKNQLDGVIPSELGNLSYLGFLSLSNNQLIGIIPGELGNLSNLYSFGIFNNQLIGCYDVNLINISAGNNALISDGNSFDVPWEDFSNNAAGACGPNPYPNCRQNDSISLVTFHNATNGANWITPWNLSQPMNTWNGVTLNGFGCVTHLSLRDRLLNGSIPPEIGNLYHLRNLDLYDNQLSGTIPAELGNLVNLNNLVFGRNQLTGNIPTEFGNLNNLHVLQLNSNQLDGNIPYQLGNLQNLQILWLTFNQLSGNIPASLGSLVNLTQLSMRSNLLTGNIPSSFGNLSDLTQLSLGNNQLTGNIPASLGNLNNLTYLSIEDNQLIGCYHSNLLNLCYIGNNSYISDGNNFDASWEDFCVSNTSICEDTFQSISLCTYGQSTPITIESFPSDLSGITYSPATNRLYMVQNETPTVYETDLSGNFLRTIPLSGFQDTEGIAHISGSRFAVAEERRGRITFFNILPITTSIDYNDADYVQLPIIDEPWGGDDGLEGVSYDPETNTIFTVKEKTPKGYYSFTMPTSFPSTLSVTDINIVCDMAQNPFSLLNVSDVYHLNQLNNIIPVTTHSLLISGDSQTLIEMDDYCNEISSMALSVIGQPKGITMDIYGTIYIVCEPGLLYIHYPEATLPDTDGDGICDWEDICSDFNDHLIGTACNDNNDCTDNDIYTTDCECTGIIICSPTIVYPGDFNNDGIANNADLLQWGLAEGITGIPRPNANLSWTPQDCPDWQSYFNSVNTKHCDGDGNGSVDINDVQALINNYGDTHNYNPDIHSESPLKFRLEAINNPINNGPIEITYELYVESSFGGSVSMHGVAASIDLSNMAISDISNSVTFDASNSVLQPQEQLVNYDDTQDVLNIALTRTDKSNRVCDGPLGIIIIISEDLPSGGQYQLNINNGQAMSANGILSDVAGGVQVGFVPEMGVNNELSVSLSATYSQCNNPGEATVQVEGGSTPYTYLWSTGETTQQVNNLTVGEHDVTVTDAIGTSKKVEFKTEWAFTPVDVYATSTQICVDFEDAPLSEAVQASFNGASTFENPINENTCYNKPDGTYNIWMQSEEDVCPVDFGNVKKCSSQLVNAKMAGISSQFGQFATKEFTNNFIKAERGYIKHRKEVHHILNSKDERHDQVNVEFKALKEVALSLLYQTFTSNKTQPIIKADHLLLIDKFLVSLYEASANHDLKNEIANVRKHLNVMRDKEVKTALIDFDKAGLEESDELPYNLQQLDEDFNANLINTVGREAYLNYQANMGGTINIKLFDVEGRNVQQSLTQTINEGLHLNKISKQNLTKGIYYLQVNFQSIEGDTVDKVFKLSVIQ